MGTGRPWRESPGAPKGYVDPMPSTSSRPSTHGARLRGAEHVTRCVAFLRAINVGGHVVTMETLRGLFVALGLKDVETFIASGNVIFTKSATRLPVLHRRIEERLRTALGYEVKTFIRSEAEVAAIASYQPFPKPEVQRAKTLAVGFLTAPLEASAKRIVMALRTEIDSFHVHGREVYWLSKKKQSDSTFSNARFEKATNCRATFRGLSTVTRLVAKYGWLSCVLCATLGVLPSCQRAARAPDPNATAATRDAIATTLQRYMVAARAVNAESIASFFSPTGMLLEPGIAPIHTRDSIRAFMASFPGVQVDSATATADTIEIWGGSALVWGSFFERLRFPGQPPSEQHGEFVMQWVRQADGTWLIQRYLRVPVLTITSAQSGR